MPRGTAVVVLAVVALAGAVASTSVRADTPAAPRSGWSGTIVYTYSYAQHEVRNGGASVTDTNWNDRVEIVVENGVATASVTHLLTQDETYFWSGCNKPPGHNVYTWAVGDSSEPVSFSVQADPGRYTVFTGLVSAPGTVTHTNNGHDRGCAAVNTSETQPWLENLQVLLPMSGARPAGIDVLSGSKTEPIESKCGGGFDSCTGGGSEEVTWSLVRTKKLELNELTLFDRDSLYGVRTKPEQRNGVRPKEFTPLQFLSASAHPWFDKSTVIYGTLELDGFAEDRLERLVVEVQWGDETVRISVTSGGVIGSGFADGLVTVSNPEELGIPLPASLLGTLNQERNGKLTLRIKAVSEWGDEAVKTFQVEKLVRYAGTNRFGDRDAGYGGDSWVKPQVLKYLEGITGIGNRTTPKPVKFQWGDMSNMNGGRFYPHAAHREGLDVEGTFAGFHHRFQPTAYAAKVLVALLQSSYGRHIRSIQVSFKNGDAFHQVVRRAAQLPDGRRPAAVILRAAGLEFPPRFKIWFKDL